jgi:ATPase subunit of ABC transporter with duplicated ATPase domains
LAGLFPIRSVARRADESPRHRLDIASVSALEQALRGFPGVIVVVSHDSRFLSALGLAHRLDAQAGGWALSDLG